MTCLQYLLFYLIFLISIYCKFIIFQIYNSIYNIFSSFMFFYFLITAIKKFLDNITKSTFGYLTFELYIHYCSIKHKNLFYLYIFCPNRCSRTDFMSFFYLNILDVPSYLLPSRYYIYYLNYFSSRFHSTLHFLYITNPRTVILFFPESSILRFPNFSQFHPQYILHLLLVLYSSARYTMYPSFSNTFPIPFPLLVLYISFGFFFRLV